MTRELKELYDEYDRIQGDNPIFIGSLLCDRVCSHSYKERTMRQIVGLLQEFVGEYESDVCKRNTRYTVSFSFDGRSLLSISYVCENAPLSVPSGPYMIVIDFIDEKCVCLVCWNNGDIKKLHEDMIDLDFWYDGFHAGVKMLRASCGLPDSSKWKPLDIRIENNILLVTSHYVESLGPDQIYDIPWNEIDATGSLSPIKGLDAVVTKQIAEYLSVSSSYVLDCMRASYEGSCFRNGYVGIAYADADEAVRKIKGAVRDKNGATLPLENGNVIHVPNSQTQYFSRYATVWIIGVIRGMPDFVAHQKMVSSSVEKNQNKQIVNDSLVNKYNLSWNEVCKDGILSPIRGIGFVSKKQVAEYLGVDAKEIQKYVSSFRMQFDKLGMVVKLTKDIAQESDSAKQNDDYSFDVLLENGNWAHISPGRNIFFSAPAFALLLDVLELKQENK